MRRWIDENLGMATVVWFVAAMVLALVVGLVYG
jgi:hypothetical protein